MVDQIAVVEFTTPASATTLDITSPSITEAFSCAIFLWSNFDTDSADNDDAVVGIGFCTANANSTPSPNFQNLSTCVIGEDGLTTSPNTFSIYDANECIIAGTPNGLTVTRTIEGAYQSSISGGVRLNFSTASRQTKGIAILFAGLADSCCTVISSVAGGGATAQTCPSGTSGNFEPDLLVLIPSPQVGIPGAETVSEAQIGLGFALNDGVPTQKWSFINWDDGVEPSDADGVVRSDSAFGFVDTTTRALFRGVITAFSATGYSHDGVDGDVRARVLAIKFSGSTFVTGAANEAISSSTGTQTFTGLGMTPQVVLGMTTLIAAEDTLTDGSTVGSFGWFVTGDQDSRAYTGQYQEGLTAAVGTPTVGNTRQEDVALLAYNNTAGIAQRATWVGGTANGFQLSFSTATAGYMTVLGIALALPAVVVSETVGISDNVVAFLNRTLVLSETVSISDQVVLDTTDVSDTEGPQGWTFEPHAERGESLSARAVQGTVL